MSFATKPAFVHYSDFDSTSRKHPAMEWMERYRDDYDSGSFDPKWYAPDFTYVAPDGTVHEGREKALEALKALYGPLPAWRHEATYLNCIETDFGYEAIGKATMWALLPGEPAAGETKKKDGNGKSWDLNGPGSFRFHYIKDGDSFLLKRTEINADTAPIAIGMVKRGVITAKDLGI
ncbi:hypothetical protein H2198_000865 [Neophaeococcomyces mojaviensis]|uniref:Uncharacterized protein n=1 Tax=Neophaeococcomyces mojaviensis TaxID=3383035 RepID=A0ACC3AIL3_9EURO|nr:hypothetical protein H2198_000865 [Knufia sp. JES_112]